MASRRPALDWRRWYAWLGVVLLAAIAALSAAHLLGEVVTLLRGLPRADLLAQLLLLGLVLAGLALLVAVILRRPAPRGRAELVAFLAALAGALAVRVALAVLVDAPLGVETSDASRYDQLAAGVLEGSCCFDPRPMGYAVLLAGSYGLLGRGPLAGEVLGIALALGTAVALYAIARRSYGVRAGLIATVLYAAWPAGALFVLPRLTEGAYTLSFVAATAAAVAGGRALRWDVLTGSLLAISQYIRPTTPVLLPAFLLSRLLGERWRRGLASTVALVLPFVLLLTPVMAYNLEAHGEPSISTSAYGGWSLLLGTNVAHGGEWNVEDAAMFPGLSPGDTWEDSKVAERIGRERLVSDIPAFVGLVPRKLDTFWGTERYGLEYAMRGEELRRDRWAVARLAIQGAWTGIVALAALGLFLRRRRLDRLMALTIGATVLVSGVHALLEVRDRYHLYLVPLFIALAAGALTAAHDTWRLRRRRGRPAG